MNNKKITKAIILATAALTLSTGITVSAASYTDVAPNDWYYPNIVSATSTGIVNGYEDNTFRPNNTVTLGECLKMVLNYKGIICGTEGYHWAANYCDKAYDLGIIEWGQFDSLDKQLSRQQVARIVIRALGEGDVEFDTALIPDFALVGDDYKQYVAQAYAKGIITGFEDGSFIGDKAITRAELLAVLDRAFNPNSRVTLDTSNRKTDIAYVRKDIDIRVNGIHTAMSDDRFKDIFDYHVVQKDNKLYLPQLYFMDQYDGLALVDWNNLQIQPYYTDVNYRDSSKTYTDKTSVSQDLWVFRNDWQVSNKISAVLTENVDWHAYPIVEEAMLNGDIIYIADSPGYYLSLSFLREYGIKVEYDAENRVVYLGEKEIKLYQSYQEYLGHEFNGIGYSPVYGEVHVRDTPIVSCNEDIYNCAMNPRAPTFVRAKGDLGSEGNSLLNDGYTCSITGYIIMNVSGMEILPMYDTCGNLYDLETGVCLDPRGVNTTQIRCQDLDLKGAKYVISTNDFDYSTSAYIWFGGKYRD